MISLAERYRRQQARVLAERTAQAERAKGAAGTRRTDGVKPHISGSTLAPVSRVPAASDGDISARYWRGLARSLAAENARLREALARTGATAVLSQPVGAVACPAPACTWVGPWAQPHRCGGTR